MKKRVISFLLSLFMLLSACALCLTGCSIDKDDPDADATTDKKNDPVTLVMWCVTESAKTLNAEGELVFDEETQKQVDEVVMNMTMLTEAELNAKLIVKYFTIDEYYEKLEAALKAQEEAKKLADEEKKNNKGNKGDKTENKKEETDEEEFPEVSDYQVDILYLAGYDRYVEYIDNKWLASLTTELNGDAKSITNYVPASLLNAVRYKGAPYAIPNNNIIGEYTYMLIDKVLFDKYYYTASVPDVHSIVDLADFLEDVANYEAKNGVVPIDGDVNYCMSLLAHYWDINPDTFALTGNFSVLGYAYKSTDSINRGSVALKFDNLLTDETYINSLKNLMNFQFEGYFQKPEEGQTSAVSFVTGDAAEMVAYEEDYYVVVVDYPRASNEDIYDNMFAVSAFSSDVNRSMRLVALMNTNEKFRNLFQYGVEKTNYTVSDDGVATPTRNNLYKMDIAKTGNQFVAYIPEGVDKDLWEFAKKQNRESLVMPLLGFDFKTELVDDSKDMEDPQSKAKKYVIETLNVELIRVISEYSAQAWDKIMACKTIEALEETLDFLALDVTALTVSVGKEGSGKDEVDVKVSAMDLAMNHIMVEQEFEADGKVKVEVDDETKEETPTVPLKETTVIVKPDLRSRQVVDKEGNPVLNENGEPKIETYLVYYKQLTPHQIYYRWMQTYGFLPAGAYPAN